MAVNGGAMFGETIVEFVERILGRKPEPEYDYELVYGEPPYKFARMTDEEAMNTNTLFRQLGMDRRWMRRGL